MSAIYEIAYAAASRRLCLFTGTGFSKAVTDNEAPSWQALLEALCDLTKNTTALKSALFPTSGKHPLSLEEAAQVIALELSAIDKNIHDEISRLIGSIKLKGNNSVIEEFLLKTPLRVVTTNYDKLLEQVSGVADCQSITPGHPIPRAQARIKVYHVHGSIDSPQNMVVTSNDYFRFLNGESYFSRKLSTVLHENTVVILGYSLGDTNLKAIISEYKAFSNNHSIGSSIFLVSRSKVHQHVKDYYSHCYGIRVLDELDVHTFFHQLNKVAPELEKRTEVSIGNIKKVVLEGRKFKPEFLKIENSFFEIISSLAAAGFSVNDTRVVVTLGDIIKTKIEHTRVSGAWEQYEHLARWLIHLASVLELRGTSIEDIYLEAVKHSMTTMSKELRFGYSWHAFTSWNTRWPEIIASNRNIIRQHIVKSTGDADALYVVSRA